MERDIAQEEKLRYGTAGERVRYWRQIRGFASIAAFARELKCSYTTLASLEAGKVAQGKLLPTIAQKLEVSYEYLVSGKGDALAKNHAALAAPREPSKSEWPLPAISRARFDRLDEVELGYLQSELTVLLDKIEGLRQKRNRG